MLKELLQHVKCKRLEEERAEAIRLAALKREEHARRRAHESERKHLQAECDRQELRARILKQLNAILETRDTLRGLVVNIPDDLFDSSFTLRPIAREKLKRITEIVLSYPGLMLAPTGHIR